MPFVRRLPTSFEEVANCQLYIQNVLAHGCPFRRGNPWNERFHCYIRTSMLYSLRTYKAVTIAVTIFRAPQLEVTEGTLSFALSQMMKVAEEETLP